VTDKERSEQLIHLTNLMKLFKDNGVIEADLSDDGFVKKIRMDPYFKERELVTKDLKVKNSDDEDDLFYSSGIKPRR